MELKSLAAKPQLVKISIADEETLAIYQEPVVFYTWDRQNMDTFVRLATLDYKDMAAVTDIVKEMVLDSTGQPIVTADQVLPTDILMKAINQVVEQLGKSVSPALTPQTETSK